uniref:Glabrous enhancer-binding protein-like DBD domain-containing protein n=1 Tax=Oryza sativa subsp. indica TaxID=39946 RepID=Q0P163_ORYSI|nr:hypothetical protein TQR14A11.2 [Oryza sativa Indica Group]AAZ06246.1 hypothetical protein TQR14A11.2 [Oryza sativa Indica Group]
MPTLPPDPAPPPPLSSFNLNKQQQGHLAGEALTQRSLGRAGRPMPKPKQNPRNRNRSPRPARIVLHHERPRPRHPRQRRGCSLATKRNNKRKQVAAFERSWSRANKLRIPRAMANHANNHHGALPDTHNLFAALASCLDRRDADLPNLVDKVHKLKIWYDNACLHQCSSTDDDDHEENVV